MKPTARSNNRLWPDADSGHIIKKPPYKENLPAARQALLKRARLNNLARAGKYAAAMERET